MIREYLHKLARNIKVSVYLRVLCAQILKDTDALVAIVHQEPAHAEYAMGGLVSIGAIDALKQLITDSNLGLSTRIKAVQVFVALGNVGAVDLSQIAEMIETLDNSTLHQALWATRKLAEIMEEKDPALAKKIWYKIYHSQLLLPQESVQVFKRLHAVDYLLEMVKSSPAFSPDMMGNSIISKI